MSVFNKIEDKEKKEYAETVFHAIKNRRAIRWIYSYEEKPLSKEYLEQIIDAGCNAPSPENYQPWEFVVVTDLEVRKAIARLGRVF